MNRLIKYFIDIDNQRAFDGSYPYTHWLEGKQSINILYVKRLCFAVDPSDNIYISIPKNNVFHILQDPSEWGEAEDRVDHFTYEDLNKHIVEDDVYYPVNTTNVGSISVACCYVVCSSPVSLEASQQIFFKNDDGDIQTILIGADFYDEREELLININNQGSEFPEVIQRAIYDSNVHEEAKDNILMNRKYKELLMDYIDILGTRGSYSSLINSLEWFGYGDVVKLKEYWKRNGRYDDYESSDIKSVLDDHLKNMLSKYTKTTYYGIYCACQQIDGYEKGLSADDMHEFELEGHYEKEDPEYNDYHVSGVYEHEDKVYVANKYEHEYSGGFIAEPIPALKAVSFKWSKEDMMIKMVLLGNFFESYFMPIHLDLIHATIEDVVYTNAVKIDAGDSKISRNDYIIQDQDIKCSVKNGSVFTLSDISAGADASTLFANSIGDDYDSHVIVGVKDTSPTGQVLYNKSENIINLLGNDNNALVNTDFLYSGSQTILSREATIDDIINIEAAKEAIISDASLSMHTSGEVTLGGENNDSELKTIMLNLYHGPGVVIPFNIVIPSAQGDIIYKEEVSMKSDDNDDWTLREFTHVLRAQRDNIYDKEEKYSIRLSFNLLCTQDRDYDIRIACYSNSGQKYIKRINFTVTDTKGSYLDLYKVKFKQDGKTPDGCLEANNYAFNHMKSRETNLPCPYYTQYISADSSEGPSAPNILDRNVCLRELLIMRGQCTTNESRGSQVHAQTHTLDDYVNNALAQLYYEYLYKKYSGVMFNNSFNVLYYSVCLQVAVLASRYIGSAWIKENGGDVNSMFNNVHRYIDEIPSRDIIQIYDSLKSKMVGATVNITDQVLNNIKNDIFDEYALNQLRIIFNTISQEDVDRDTLFGNVAELNMLPTANNDDKFNFRIIRVWMYMCHNYDLITRKQNGNDKYYIWVAKELYSNNIIYTRSTGENDKTEILEEFLNLIEEKPTYEFLLTNRKESYRKIYNELEGLRGSDLFGVQEMTSQLLNYTLYQTPGGSTNSNSGNPIGPNDFDTSITTCTKYDFKNLVFRHEKIYFPQDHYLAPIDRSSVEALRVTPYETLAVIPHVKYLRQITDWEWNFYNASTKKDNIVKYNDGNAASISEPFVSSQENGVLDPGYYDIKFKYRVSTEPSKIHELVLHGAFIMTRLTIPLKNITIEGDDVINTEDTTGLVSYKFKYDPSNHEEKITLVDVKSTKFSIISKDLNGFNLIYKDVTEDVSDTIIATFEINGSRKNISKDIIIKYGNSNYNIDISGPSEILVFGGDENLRSYNYTFDTSSDTSNLRLSKIRITPSKYENYITVSNQNKKGFTITPNTNLLKSPLSIVLEIDGIFQLRSNNSSATNVFSKKMSVDLRYIEPLSIQIHDNYGYSLKDNSKINITAVGIKFSSEFDITYTPDNYDKYSYYVVDKPKITFSEDIKKYIECDINSNKIILKNTEKLTTSSVSGRMDIVFDYKDNNGTKYTKEFKNITLYLNSYEQATIQITGVEGIECQYGDKQDINYTVEIQPENFAEEITFQDITGLGDVSDYVSINKNNIDDVRENNTRSFSITYNNNYKNTDAEYKNNIEKQILINPPILFEWGATYPGVPARVITAQLPTTKITLKKIPKIDFVTLTVNDNKITSDYSSNGESTMKYKINSITVDGVKTEDFTDIFKYYKFAGVSDTVIKFANDSRKINTFTNTLSVNDTISPETEGTIEATDMFGAPVRDVVCVSMNFVFERISDGVRVSIPVRSETGEDNIQYNLTYANVIEPFILYNNSAEACSISMSKMNSVDLQSMKYFVIENYVYENIYCDGNPNLYNTWAFKGSSTDKIDIPSGAAIAIKCNSDSSLSSADGKGYTRFEMEGGCVEAYGDISLLTKDYNYQYLFRDCTRLTKAPELPGGALTKGCYRGMFYGCTNLAEAPELPATTLAERCYDSMFYGCTRLTETPTLPATTLAERCYDSMFYGCTGLTNFRTITGQEGHKYILNASTLADYCCNSMFCGCTSLESISEDTYISSAGELKPHCYSHMFEGCTKLTTPTHDGVNSSTRRVLSSSDNLALADYCCEYMFDGCTSMIETPLLDAVTLVDGCYSGMFLNCTKLTMIWLMAKDDNVNNIVRAAYLGDWVQGVTSESGQFITNSLNGNNFMATGDHIHKGLVPLKWTHYESKDGVTCTEVQYETHPEGEYDPLSKM